MSINTVTLSQGQTAYIVVGCVGVSTGSVAILQHFEINASFDKAETISINVNKTLRVYTSNQKLYYRFTPPETGFYTIESSNNATLNGVQTDPKVWLYNSTRGELIYDDDSTGNRNFRLVYHLDSTQTYYIGAGCYNTGIGNYHFKITKTANLNLMPPTKPTLPSTPQQYSTLSTTANRTVNIEQPYQRLCYSFTAPTAGIYVFESSGNSTSSVQYGFLYDNDGNMMASNITKGATIFNFYMAVKLTAGKTYYLVAGCVSNGTGNYLVRVQKNYSARIVYNNSCNYSSTGLKTIFNEATTEFEKEFGISFNLNTVILNNDLFF